MVNLTKANRFAHKSARLIDITLSQLYNLTIKLVGILEIYKNCPKKQLKKE